MKKVILGTLSFSFLFLAGCGKENPLLQGEATSVSQMMKNEKLVGWIDYKKDSDFDKIPDYKDKCPHTKYGVVVDKNGCIIDSDGDGIDDYKDKCPNTPKGLKVNYEGCYVFSLLEIIKNNKNYEIEKDFNKKINEIGNILKHNKNIKINMEVYADKTENKTLFLKMANELKKILVNKFKLSSNRIKIAYRGIGFKNAKAIVIVDNTKYYSNKKCTNIDCLIKK